MAKKVTFPIVKISWQEHNRQYEVGIIKFLKEMGLDITEQDVLRGIKKTLNKI